MLGLEYSVIQIISEVQKSANIRDLYFTLDDPGKKHRLAELSSKDTKRTQEYALLSAEQSPWGLTSSGGIYNSASSIYQFQGKVLTTMLFQSILLSYFSRCKTHWLAIIYTDKPLLKLLNALIFLLSLLTSF